MGSADGPLLARAFAEARDVGAALGRAGLSVAVAESCTGGLLGAALTAIPGASAYVRGGVIAYADDVKRDLLDVDGDLLDTHGAVSEPVAAAMAEGVRRRLHADIGLAVTGIAGPSGEGMGKPVGLCYVAIDGPGEGRHVETIDEDHGREANRALAVHVALRLCRHAVGGAGG
jgi:PncC family amidohydrolase